MAPSSPGQGSADRPRGTTLLPLWAPRAKDPGCRLLLLVGREDREGAALERGDGPEGTLIEGEEAARGVSLGDDHERRAGQPEPQVAVAGDDVASRPELGPVQALDDERALGQVLEEGELDVRPQPIEDQAVRLGDRELRGDQRLALVLEDGPNGLVARFVRIGRA